jgi:hypothetical protein
MSVKRLTIRLLPERRKDIYKEKASTLLPPLSGNTSFGKAVPFG